MIPAPLRSSPHSLLASLCLGIALANLSDEGAIQLTLPFDRNLELDAVLDSIHDRFGSTAITRGVLVGRDPGPWVPLLPD